MKNNAITPANHFQDLPSEQRAAVEQAWRIVNLQADSLLKIMQIRYEPWQAVTASFAAGGVVIGGITAIIRLKVGG